MSLELDKFKRRVIRSVARVLADGGQDKQADQRMWEDLQKEVGCDCKLLWERMRTLTLKKMKRLLPAEDRLRNIAEVAQMQLTDWLLFDLVLVHEDIDLIGDDPENKAMKELVNLVQSFEIEGKRGDALTTAWTAATFYYNSFGRQCSPMLLQRRWYQLKKVTRSRFYTFWYEYRGNARLLEIAKKSMPNSLHSLVAQKFPYVVTKPFMDWQEMIQEKFVILPEEFEAKMRSKNESSKTDKNEPDLVIVEPQIETIELELDSDSDNDPRNTQRARENALNKQDTPPVVTIKEEIEDEVEADAEVETVDAEDIEENTETGVVSDRVNDDNVNDVIVSETDLAQTVDNDNVTGEDTVFNKGDDAIELSDDVEEVGDDGGAVEENVAEKSDDLVEITDDQIKNTESVEEEMENEGVLSDINEEVMMPQIMNVFGNVTVPAEKLAALPLMPKAINSDTNFNTPLGDVDQSIEEVIRRKALEFTTDVARQEILKLGAAMAMDNIEVEVNETPPKIDEKVDTPEPPIPAPIDVKKENIFNPYGNIPTDMEFVDDGIELVDDGIAFTEDDEDDEDSQASQSNESGASNTSDKEVSKDTPKFDLKLLMQPIVYTLKLDHMTVLKDKDIKFIKDEILLESAYKESKPAFPHPITEPTSEDMTQSEEDKQSDSSDSEDGIPEKNRVTLSSYLLQKPRSRSYNPIQLCKNPDFNTRLKRLTFSFLSSTRNRSLLKTLKPMTIDVCKTFERKLVNGTMYLKSVDGLMIKSEPAFEDVSEQSNAVLPSAMPIQSLIDNTSINIREILAPAPLNPPKMQDSMLNERQKTINLPDINHVRRINQQLLTAEVTPMRSNTNIERPSVESVAAQDTALGNLRMSEEQDSKSSIKMCVDPTPAIEPLGTRKLHGLHHNESKDTLKKNNLAEKLSKLTHRLKDLTSTASENKTTKIIEGPSLVQPANKLLNKPKKTISKPANHITWNKPVQPVQNTLFPEDSLLTLDTLQKMLNLCDADNNPVSTVKLKPKQVKRINDKKKIALLEGIGQYEERLKNDNQPITKDDELVIKGDQPVIKSDKSVIEEIQKESAATGTGDDKAPTPKLSIKPKLNIVKDSSPSKYYPYCCWARIKLTSELMANIKHHSCPRICKCCCREELAKKKWTYRELQKTKEIVISDDEDGSNVNSTRNDWEKPKRRRSFKNKNVEIKKVRSEVSIQCDLPAQPDEMSKEAEKATNSIITVEKTLIKSNKPAVRIVKCRPLFASKGPLSNRKRENLILLDDLDAVNLAMTKKDVSNLLLTNLNKPEPKVQGHIIIDGTKGLTVQKPISTISDELPQAVSSHYFKISEKKEKEKVVYINSKRAGKEIKAPIYLGKNKILLTDVKFPEEPVINPPIDVPKVVEQQPPAGPPVVVLPPGVQLMLLPNGTVTYSMEPGIELSDEQKLNIPSIIAAVQEQLNASGTLPGNTTSALSSTTSDLPENNDIDTNSIKPTNVGDIIENNLDVVTETNIQETTVPTIEENTTANIIDVEQNVNSCSVPQKNEGDESEIVKSNIDAGTSNTKLPEQPVNISDENNLTSDTVTVSTPTLLCTETLGDDVTRTEIINNDSATINKEISENTAASEVHKNVTKDQESSSDPAANNNRKSLLSDLMQMSGIWDDDIDTSVPKENSSTVAVGVVPSILHQSVNSVMPIEGLPVQPAIPPAAGGIPMSGLVPLTTTTPAVSSSNSAVIELTPITSFAQLKYACERNGKFFKLDLALGTLSTGIKVCIKKQLPKSVIDLTEDDDDVSEAQITQEPAKESKDSQPTAYTLPQHLSRSLLKLQNPNVTEQELVKPVKLFRSVRILKKNKEHTVLLPAIEEVQPARKRQRKQSLVDTRSEENMPVETIDDSSLDSSSLDKYIYRDSDFLDSSHDSFDGDSSDDEPLASKAKRMRSNEQSVNNPTNQQDIVQDAPAEGEVREAKERTVTEENMEVGANTDAGEMTGVGENMEVDEQQDLPGDDNDLSENLVQVLPKDLMAFMPNNIEDEEDDCILGV